MVAIVSSPDLLREALDDLEEFEQVVAEDALRTAGASPGGHSSDPDPRAAIVRARLESLLRTALL